jgi:hypothetical protein
MNTALFHQILDLDEQIKSLEGKIKDMKANRIKLKEGIIETLSESQLLGVVIGTKQIAMTQKETMNINNKEGLRKFLQENHPEFTKVEIDEKAFEAHIMETTMTDKGLEEEDEKEETQERIVPEEFKGLISFFKINDIKITKAKKQ